MVWEVFTLRVEELNSSFKKWREELPKSWWEAAMAEAAKEAVAMAEGKGCRDSKMV